MGYVSLHAIIPLHMTKILSRDIYIFLSFMYMLLQNYVHIEIHLCSDAQIIKCPISVTMVDVYTYILDGLQCSIRVEQTVILALRKKID